MTPKGNTLLKHIVLFRRKADVAEDESLESSLVGKLAGLGSQVPGILHYRIAANELSGPIGWDYVLESNFQDAAALQSYLKHPLHRSAVKEAAPYFDWASVDFTE